MSRLGLPPFARPSMMPPAYVWRRLSSAASSPVSWQMDEFRPGFYRTGFWSITWDREGAH